MSATIITKNSSTASAVPAAGSLVQGELAVNVTDKKLYTKDSGGTVQKLVGSLGNQEASSVAITGGTESGVAITGGTINNTPIGATTANTVRGTVVTATTNFVGDITGNVTGNITGNVTGTVTGNVTGNLTGNVTASSGTSSFNNVTINGTLDMNSGSAGTITGLATPSASSDAANKGYVDTAISNLIGTAPATLDTLGEIADALNDDANLAATLTASIATKVSKSGDTMSGALAMGSNKITGLGTPTADTDAATKGYVDTADALKLSLSGGTMTGNIVMGANKVTSTATPTTDDDLTRKAYVDSILGSATSAAASASAAATSATNAANSASSAADSASAAAASYDSFDDRYLGSKTSDPTLDNDGNALITGALYFNSVAGEMRVWSGSAWVAAYLPASGYATLTGTETLTNKTLGSGTALSANVTGNDSLFTRVMLQDTGWDFYDSSTTNALDYVNGSVQRWAPNTGAQTLSITNWPPSGAMGELLVQGINLGAATITWPTINWIKSDGTTTTTFSSNGVTLQASGTDWFILWTRDGGTTIYGKFVR